MDTFVGKFLVRRAKNDNGQEVLILSGMAIPDTFPIDSINNNDEIWGARLAIIDVVKYVRSDPKSVGFNGSPDDFITQSPNVRDTSEWKQKTI